MLTYNVEAGEEMNEEKLKSTVSELQRVYSEYYHGKPIEESDSKLINMLCSTEALEYYLKGDTVCARAGRVGLAMGDIDFK